MLEVLQPDLEPGDCCQTAWSKACAAGELDNATSFECRDCGSLWVPRAFGDVRLWELVPYIAVFR